MELLQVRSEEKIWLFVQQIGFSTGRSAYLPSPRHPTNSIKWTYTMTPQTITATNHDHDGHSNENVKN